ncbi:hypothetical protein SLE2022_274530 [Rubroshorea leprosula]
MRTRNGSKRQNQSSGEPSTMKVKGESKSGSQKNEKQATDTVMATNPSETEDCSGAAAGSTLGEVGVASLNDASVDDWEDNELDWEEEDGSNPQLNDNCTDDRIEGLTIEFDDPSDSARRKPVRRASAEDKELAELVHKVHLLCLLARGRLIDSACDDPLIQASLLSLLPTHLSRLSGVSKLTANALSPLVSWFHNNFRVSNVVHGKRSFHSSLAFALETREGTPEEIAALSVALFRALTFTTRFVSILDVSPLKPEADKYGSSSQDRVRVGKGIFGTSTLMVANPNEVSGSALPVKSISCKEEDNLCETSLRASGSSRSGYKTINDSKSKDSAIIDELKDRVVGSLPSELQSDPSEACTNESQALKRKGDLEFEMQLAMALSATAVETHEGSAREDLNKLNGNDSLDVSSPRKRMKKIQSVESSSSCHGVSTAIGSRKVGSPLFWAEVYCSGENMSGKWVHVDVVNAIIDGEQKVEAAAAACKTSLRYVVAFAGHGAKDVTRRYCMKWYKIASKRVNSTWWDAVLAPLRELESGTTGGMVHLEKHENDTSKEHEKAKTLQSSEHPQNCVNLPGQSGLEVSKENRSVTEVKSCTPNSYVATRNSLEDMELETRALTEPLPTNQQAYKTHKLYALERWLTRNQILHPRGPILGYCSGHPVYPRTCVQTLKPKERWLREGLQVKANELPAKVIKCPAKLKKVQVCEDDEYTEVTKGTIELYGKWQLEPLRLPRAVNGIVPKNERGQVDVWSEKCLPPGTVHLRLPRIFTVAKRLEIDYAPAMVGFEFRQGRAVPIYEGIVVCAEFKDAILEAFAEEDERRRAEEKKRNEAQALSRWYQLLSSVVTRQKLNNCYGKGSSSIMPGNIHNTNSNKNTPARSGQDDGQATRRQQEDGRNFTSSVGLAEDHEHVFLPEDQSFDEENSMRTKRCHCGFSIQVEEL